MALALRKGVVTKDSWESKEVSDMKNLLLLSVLGLGLLAAPAAQAQPASVAVRIGVGPVVVGAPPVCAYGYFPDYPYACAPYG